MLKSLFILATLVTLMGCDKGVNSPRGFSLPPGDIVKGEAVFIKMNCLTCHTLAGVESPTIQKDPTISVRLGGDVGRIKTYAELVTSVINPSHRIAKGYKLETIEENGHSKMRNYNDVMTVSELIDLVAFLQPHYTLKEYRPTSYTGYY